MQIKTIALDKQNVIALIQFTALLAVSILAPLFHYQVLTGPIVNACLFIATAMLGVQAGIMLGLLPSLIALSVGTLPAPLAPMVPFIMVSNAILVVVFAYFNPHTKQSYGVGAIAVIWASILKFLFLFSASFIVLHLIAQKPVAQKASQMMSWPQLATALLGSILTYLFFIAIKRRV